jgi:hypothetical protein
LTNIFIEATEVLGAAVNPMVADALLAALVNEAAFGEVFTRRTDSLFKITLVVPKVFGEEDAPGLYV